MYENWKLFINKVKVYEKLQFSMNKKKRIMCAIMFHASKPSDRELT